jgi:hypothetical protein
MADDTWQSLAILDSVGSVEQNEGGAAGRLGVVP